MKNKKEVEINSGESIEEGKVVTFIADSSTDYQVKGWTLDGKVVNGSNTTYTHTITKPCKITVSFESEGMPPIPPSPPNMPSVEGSAVLILSPNKLTIKVSAKTEDGKPITIESCTVATFESGYTKNTLTATSTKVVIKGNITMLDCSGISSDNNEITSINVRGLTSLQELNCYHNKLTELDVQGLNSLRELNCSQNQLTALNVKGLGALQNLICSNNKFATLDMQGLTALKELWCYHNQLTSLNVQGCTVLKRLECYANKLNCDAFIKIFNDLPTRKKFEDARACLYTEKTGEDEGNCKDFNTSTELKTAFESVKKTKLWKLQKTDESGYDKYI
ncbi:MAG: leucine-rich repeat domain-containing protein [Treponema sp.]